MLFTIVVAVTTFIVGVVVGAVNSATVANSINIIKQAEQKAEAVLSQITAHKAS